MKVTETGLPGVLAIEPLTHRDGRGFFREVHASERYAAAGLPASFVQDNHSRSSRGVLRGLHFQEPQPQGKLVQALRGAIWDVAVDIRRGSPTFGHWVAMELSEETGRQLFIPPGFAHGFCVLSLVADVVYKCTAPYVPDAGRGIVWDDPDLAIPWPVARPLLSSADAGLPRLAEADVQASW